MAQQRMCGFLNVTPYRQRVSGREHTEAILCQLGQLRPCPRLLPGISWQVGISKLSRGPILGRAVRNDVLPSLVSSNVFVKLLARSSVRSFPQRKRLQTRMARSLLFSQRLASHYRRSGTSWRGDDVSTENKKAAQHQRSRRKDKTSISGR